MSKTRWPAAVRAAWLGLALWLAMAALGTGPAAAQSERPVVVHYLAGPFDVGVLIQRSNLSVGRAVVTIFLREADGGAPVGDASVVVRTEHQVEGISGWSYAFNSPDSPENYHAQLTLEESGIWDTVVEIDSPSLGSGVVAAGTLRVPHARTYASGSYVFFGLFAALMAGAGYLLWSIRRSQRRMALDRARPAPAADSDDPAAGSEDPAGAGKP